LLAECRTLGGCPTGQARLTGGYRLPARQVIHTVGPVYHGEPEEAELLASCYRESLALADAHGLQSIAFPCISTGVYGYPGDEACEIAVATVIPWLATHEQPREVLFCCFDAEDTERYERRLAAG
jgi:O-acetyl-ADP-ribose deacetylase (regulator of RNase III)